jgi:hypothetical protein
MRATTTMRSAAPWRALLIGALAMVASGCKAEAGVPWQCTCTFLTDYDDPSRHEVEVCAPVRERAEAQARGCAQSGAPAPIQRCECQPLAGAACAVGACRAR